MDPENLKKVQQHMEKISSKVDVNKLKKEQMAGVASCLVIEGAIWRGLQKPENAKKIFNKTLTMENSIPALEGKPWIVAALYELGEMAYRENNLKESEEFLTRASKYSGYDWEDVYKSRLQKAISQLKKEQKKKESEDKKTVQKKE